MRIEGGSSLAANRPQIREHPEMQAFVIVGQYHSIKEWHGERYHSEPCDPGLEKVLRQREAQDE